MFLLYIYKQWAGTLNNLLYIQYITKHIIVQSTYYEIGKYMQSKFGRGAYMGFGYSTEGYGKDSGFEIILILFLLLILIPLLTDKRGGIFSTSE